MPKNNFDALFIYELNAICSRGAKILLTSVQSFGKIKLNNNWTVIRVTRILKFEVNKVISYALQYAKLLTETKWIDCVSGTFQYGIYSKIVDETNGLNCIFLNNSV